MYYWKKYIRYLYDRTGAGGVKITIEPSHTNRLQYSRERVGNSRRKLTKTFPLSFVCHPYDYHYISTAVCVIL